MQPPADDQVKGKGRADLSERAEQGLDEEEEDEEKPVLPAEDSKVKTLRAALWCNMAAAEIQCVSSTRFCGYGCIDLEK